MEINITINVGGNDPIEVKVDVPEKEKEKRVKYRLKPDHYSVWFDETCLGWSKHAELNKAFLIKQQEYCNEKLKRYGYLFLNEVYECLGIPKTAYGQVVGWYYNPDNPIGDNYVDFSIFEDCNRGFVNGCVMKALLTFNVDGDILNYL